MYSLTTIYEKINIAVFLAVTFSEDVKTTLRILDLIKRFCGNGFNPVITVDAKLLYTVEKAGFKCRISLFHIVKRLLSHLRGRNLSSTEIVIKLFQFKASIRAVVYHSVSISQAAQLTGNSSEIFFMECLEYIGSRALHWLDDKTDEYRSCGLVEAFHKKLSVWFSLTQTLIMNSSAKSISLTDIFSVITGVDLGRDNNGEFESRMSLFTFQQAAPQSTTARTAKIYQEFNVLPISGSIYSIDAQDAVSVSNVTRLISPTANLSHYKVLESLEALDKIVWPFKMDKDKLYLNVQTGECTCLLNRFQIPSPKSSKQCEHIQYVENHYITRTKLSYST